MRDGLVAGEFDGFDARRVGGHARGLQGLPDGFQIRLEQVMDCSQGQGLWHFPFHQAEGVAEMLVEGRERVYLEWFFNKQAARPGAISDDELSTYAMAYAGRARLSAGFGYYRSVLKDGETNRLLAERKLSIPVLAIGGETGAGEWVGGSFGQVATTVISEVVPQCGHWIADECPEWLAKRLTDFYRSGTNT